MPTSRAERRNGFTLVELIAALALAALVFVGVRSLLNQLADAGERMEREATIVNARANGERLLAALLYHVEANHVDANQDSSAALHTAGRFSFTGDPTHASFASRCETPSGWLERCAVQITLVRAADSTTVSARLSPGDGLPLFGISGSAHFIYADAGRHQLWTPSWEGSIALPRALGIVAGSERDTIVLPIEDRS